MTECILSLALRDWQNGGNCQKTSGVVVKPPHSKNEVVWWRPKDLHTHLLIIINDN